jgi:acetaldehyde dehydrogenase / alcohol dehydrogenase
MAVGERVIDKKIEVAKMVDELVANAQKAIE